MKKILVLCLLCVLTVGCRTYHSGPLFQDNESRVQPTRVEVSQSTVVEPRVQVSESTISETPQHVGVATKARGEDYVTYEYSNVRVDALLPMAQKYCVQKNETWQAVLQEILLYRNNMRRATFVCRGLANAN